MSRGKLNVLFLSFSEELHILFEVGVFLESHKKFGLLRLRATVISWEFLGLGLDFDKDCVLVSRYVSGAPLTSQDFRMR